MEEPYLIKFFKITRDSIKCFSDNTAPLIMADFYPGQPCQAEVYENRIVILSLIHISTAPRTAMCSHAADL